MQTSDKFQFDYKLSHKSVKDLKLVSEPIGDLVVEGSHKINRSASVLDIASRYEIKIDAIKWQGTDVLPVLDVTSPDTMQDIIDQAARFLSGIYNPKEVTNA